MCCLGDKMRSEMTLTKSQTKNEKKENLCDLQCCGDACILILWLHFTSPPLEGEFSERACLFEDVYWVTECEIAGWEWAVLSVNCGGGKQQMLTCAYLLLNKEERCLATKWFGWSGYCAISQSPCIKKKECTDDSEHFSNTKTIMWNRQKERTVTC